MRRSWSSGVLVILMLVPMLVPGVATAAPGDDEWTVDGGGWGHGIGLSQYGAKGMADDGKTSDEILSFYYQGTDVRQAPDLLGANHWIFGEEALWVGLRQADTSVSLSVTGEPLSVCQPEDCSQAQFEIEAGDTWVFERGTDEHAEECRFRKGTETNNGYGPCEADVSWNNNGGGTRAIVNGAHYAHGTLRLRPAGEGKFHTVLSVDLEKYLYGLAEVPSSWPSAALDAQAIIGRGYAIATALFRDAGKNGQGRLDSCGCHIRDDTRDQAYSGWSKESGESGQQWVAAVDRTAGKIVHHPGAPNGIISAYYSSSNGGYSENVEDVWGGAPLPWLRSVEDPWSANPAINPLARWTVFIEGSVMKSELCKLGHCWDAVTDAETLKEPPAARFRLFGLKGRTIVSADVSAAWMYNRLNAHGTETDPNGGRRAARVSPYILRLNAPTPFRDVGASVHYDDIVYIANLGITKGCNPPDNTLFCPGHAVTRQQMASFLVRALELPRADRDYFSDDVGSVHEQDINALAAAGITRGCNPPDNTRFCPEQPVSRGQMAAFLVRAYGYADPGAGNLFTDDNGSVFEGDIDRLAMAGVTKGCNPPDNSRFCPTDPVTRQQMASFLARAIRQVEG